MGKKKAKKVKGPNRSKVTAGDLYSVTNSVTVVDVDGDGVSDLVATHLVLKNGAKFVQSETTWFGLEDEVRDFFEDALAEELLTDEQLDEVKFKDVSKNWKKLTRFLTKINKLADVKADELGE